MTSNSEPRFFAYPEPQATDIPWKEPPPGTNPVFRGLPLLYGAYAVESLNFVATFLYNNAGFNSLRKIKAIEGVECRYDPTVIPIRDETGIPVPKYTDAANLRAPREGTKGYFWSVKDYHEAYKSGKLTPTDVVNSLLPLIRRDVANRSDHSTAFLTSRVDLITQAAEASTRRYAEGKPLGVLDGVPVAIKDEVDIKGYKKCLGTKLDFTLENDETSWCVQKWEEEGAIVMGKTNMHELGLDTTNNNPNFGTPKNPYNGQYYTGGSSGGSAYSVSSGLVPIALGVDGGGSIRIPSSYCGIYGLKPSHGRVSDRPSPQTANTNGCIGPMAVDMSSLEVAFRVMAKPDPAHHSSVLFPPSRPLTTPRPKLLGLFKPWFDRSDQPVRDLCNAALTHLTKTHGYQILPITLPLLPEGQTAHAVTILNEILNGHPDISGFTPANKVLLAVAAKAPTTDFLKAQQLRNLLMQHLAHLFTSHPGLVIVVPTTPTVGWPIKKGAADLRYGVSDGDMSMRSMEYVWLANFTGCPAITVPVGYAEPAKGYGEGSVPVGLMGMGEWGSEDALIEFGYDGEAYLHEAYEGGRRRPGNWVDLFGVGGGEEREEVGGLGR